MRQGLQLGEGLEGSLARRAKCQACQAPGARCQLLGARCLVLGARCQARRQVQACQARGKCGVSSLSSLVEPMGGADGV